MNPGDTVEMRYGWQANPGDIYFSQGRRGSILKFQKKLCQPQGEGSLEIVDGYQVRFDEVQPRLHAWHDATNAWIPASALRTVSPLILLAEQAE